MKFALTLGALAEMLLVMIVRGLVWALGFFVRHRPDPSPMRRQTTQTASRAAPMPRIDGATGRSYRSDFSSRSGHSAS